MRINRVARTYRLPVKTDREIKRLAKLNSTPGKKCSEADVVAAAIGTKTTVSAVLKIARSMIHKSSPMDIPEPLRFKTQGEERTLLSLRPGWRGAARRDAIKRARREKRPCDFVGEDGKFRQAHPNGTVEVL